MGKSKCARHDCCTAFQKCSKVTKSKKVYFEKPGLATIAKEITRSYRPATKIPDQQIPINDTLEVHNVLRSSEINTYTCFFHNAVYFTLEECQLAISLRKLGADDDLVSEIMKYERASLAPINCAGLVDNLIKACYTMRAPVIVPLMADVEAAQIQAQNAYTKWMNHMTGVIWGFQERGRIQEVLDMAPYPFRWMSLVPSRPKIRRLLFGELNEITSGRPPSKGLLFGEFNETTDLWHDLD